MNIIHFSDSYLGYKQSDFLYDDSLNERKNDFFDAFYRIISEIEIIKPKYIIYTGNLFYENHISNILNQTLELFQKINDLNIPFILISGIRNLGNQIFKNLGLYNNIYVCYESYDKFEFDDIIFHCYPSNEKFHLKLYAETYVNINFNKNKKNILLFSGSITRDYETVPLSYRYNCSLNESFLNKLDYVALGGYHSFCKVDGYKNVYYSGSTERIEYEDVSSKGYIYLNIDNDLKVEFRKIKIRPKYYYTIDYNNYLKEMNSIDLPLNLEESIVNIKILNLSSYDVKSNKYLEILDYASKLFQKAFIFNIKHKSIRISERS
jgi:DNA repair exonuclease SbcCD nuclease subunit